MDEIEKVSAPKDQLDLFDAAPSITASQIQGLQGQLDRMAQLLQNVIFGVVIGLVFVAITVAVEVILFHSNSVSEEEYIHAMELQKENLILQMEKRIDALNDSQEQNNTVETN